MAGICTSPYPSPHPIEKVGDSSYPYPYPINAGIPCQNGDEFGQYPRGRVYLPSPQPIMANQIKELLTWKPGTCFTKIRSISQS